MHLPAHLLLMILAGDYYPVSNKMPLSHKIQVCCKKWFYCRCLSFYGQQPPPPTVTLPYPPITITFLISLPRTFTQYNTVHRTSEFRPGVVYCLRGDCLGGTNVPGVCKALLGDHSCWNMRGSVTVPRVIIVRCGIIDLLFHGSVSICALYVIKRPYVTQLSFCEIRSFC